MASSNPLDQLADDHGELSVLVFEILNALEGPAAASTVSQDWLRDHLVGLREVLLLHFAREEEGLFPFVRQHFPEAAPRVAGMEAAHDGICGNVTRMAYASEQSADTFAQGLPTITSNFMRFLDDYVAHSRLESELMSELMDRLDPEQSETLTALLGGL